MFNDYSQEPMMPNDAPVNLSGRANIKVIGVGGAGNNAVNRMISAGITSAEFYVVNTDNQALASSPCEHRIQIGAKLTNGLGAGAEPETGRAAAEESKEILTEAVKGTDLLFITAGMGGGTGTGAAPVIAKIARDMKILTVAVVTEPFDFEGRKRRENTVKGLDNLKKYVDTLIIIPNDKIKTVVEKNTPFAEALRVADDILKQGIKGLAELIVNPSLINLDFADVKTILKDKGIAHLGVGVAKGDNRVLEAVRLAVNCPLLETTIEGAKGVILNIVGGQDLTYDEVTSAAKLVSEVVDASANIIFGARIDPNVHDEVEITIIATGFPATAVKTDSAPAQNTAQKPVQQTGSGRPSYYNTVPGTTSTSTRTQYGQTTTVTYGGYGQRPAQQPIYQNGTAPYTQTMQNGYNQAQQQAQQTPYSQSQQQGAYGQNTYGQPQNPYGQNQQAQQNTYGQQAQGQYGQPQGQYGQSQQGAYAQQSQNPYGQNQQAQQNTYGQQAQNQYGQSQQGYAQQGTQQAQQNTYAQQAQNPYGQNQQGYGQTQYDSQYTSQPQQAYTQTYAPIQNNDGIIRTDGKKVPKFAQVIRDWGKKGDD